MESLMTDRQIINLVWTALIVISYVVGLFVGRWIEHERLVQCEEDEVWYPLPDFTGSETPEDLVCVHMEDPIFDA